MTTRGLTTAATLLVAAAVLAVMAVWGLKAATAPVGGTSSSSGPTCPSESQTVIQYVRRGDVTVSVYNAGNQSGRAQATMALLERAGFKPGEVNNAPDGTNVPRAVVYSTKTDDPAAELVARALGRKTQVVHSEDDLGPGVDVVIGDKFKRLDPSAPTKLKLPQPVTTCD